MESFEIYLLIYVCLIIFRIIRLRIIMVRMTGYFSLFCINEDTCAPPACMHHVSAESCILCIQVIHIWCIQSNTRNWDDSYMLESKVIISCVIFNILWITVVNSFDGAIFILKTYAKFKFTQTRYYVTYCIWYSNQSIKHRKCNICTELCWKWNLFNMTF